MPTRVEDPEIISAKQRCFRDLTFFSADSENMKDISTVSDLISSDFLWINTDQNWFYQLWNLGFSTLNSADSTLIYSESALY